jgi:hypothetical protein
VAEEEFDGFELASDDGPVEGGLAVGATGGEVRAVVEEELDYVIPTVFTGPEECVAPVFGWGGVEEAANVIQVAESGGGGQVEFRTAGGEECGGGGMAVRQARGDERWLFERRATVQEGLE